MAKKLENSWSSRFLKWVQQGSGRLDDEMMAVYDEDHEAYIGETNEEALRLNEAELIIHEQMQEADLTAGADAKVFRRRTRWAQFLYTALSVLVALSIILVLLQTVQYLPSFGGAENPVNNEVSRRYIEQGMQETGAVNIVAGMILDYRAFDTLGESNVLFVATCVVLLLLRISADSKDKRTEALMMEADDRMYEPKNDLILQHIAKLLVPFILMYGMYVIMNGHISPGGGFSGGAVMGAGLILFLTAFGFRKTERFFTIRTFRVISVSALSFYAVSKTYSFFTGANHLHSIITPGTPGKLFSAGLIPYLNLAVGLVVCCTMYAFYTLFRKGDM